MMKIIKCLLLLIGFILLFSSAFSQTSLSVQGIVKDDMETLVGVNIIVMNAEDRVYTGVATDINGSYILKIPEGTDNLSIVFSFIGYKTKKVAYKGQKTINMTLESDAQLLDEIIVRGKADVNELGISYKNISSSVERMTIEGADEMPVTSLGDALQGRLANVDIVSSSGAPGSGMSIRIRGISSLSASSEPLIVLDGVPMETSFDDNFDFATATDEDLSGLVNLSPGDIESIEVLKDAPATAIYGPRAANGVLKIKTKQGVVGPMRFTVNQKFSYNFEPDAIDLLDGKQYVTLVQDALWNQGLEGDQNAFKKIAAPEINFDPTYPEWREFNQDTDWLEEISRGALLSETTATMSGGGERATYNFSMAYLSEAGTTVGTDFNRLNSRLNLAYKFSRRFRVDMGISFSQGLRNSHFSADSRSMAMKHMPNVSPYIMEEDAVTRTDIYFAPENILDRRYPTVYNTVAMANETKNENLTRGTSLRLNVIYDFDKKLKGLKYTGLFSFNTNTTEKNSFLPFIVTGAKVTSDNYNKGTFATGGGSQLYMSNHFTYVKNVKVKHSFVGNLKMEVSDNRNDNQSSAVVGMSSVDLANPILGTGRIVEFKSSKSNTRDFGLVGSLNYVYDSRYIFNATYRYGANSRLNKTKRWKGTPAFSIAWRADNENFLEGVNWISELKFRGSWGINLRNPSGNSAGVGRFSTGDNYGHIGSVGPVSMDLTQLDYETSVKINGGVDMSLFNNKLHFTFDMYQNITTDLLQRSAKVPSHTGYERIEYFNSGQMSNTGWEFRGNSNDLIPGDFLLTLRFNMSGNKNIMDELPDNVNYLQYPATIENGTYAQNVQSGDALGSYYGFKSKGVYKDSDATYIKDNNGNYALDILGNPIQMKHHTRTVRAGDANYEDVNNDGLIDMYDIVHIGNSQPDFTGGAGFTFGYKSLTLTTYFHARLGYNIINKARMQTESMHTYDNQSVNVIRRWRHEGDVTDVPKAIFGAGKHWNWLGSDRFVEDGSFIRLKELRLSYNFPQHILKTLGVNSFSVFVTGFDLFTWTKYSGQDPEVNINGGLDQDGKFELMGVDNARTPKPRRMSMGLNIRF